MKNPKYSIIIATKNEEEAIAKVLCSIPKEISKQSEIIVVDSSNDYTPIIAEKLGAKVIKSKEGKGRQVKKGVKKSKGDILLFMTDVDLYTNKSGNVKETYGWVAPEIRDFVGTDDPYKPLNLWGPPWLNWGPGQHK